MNLYGTDPEFMDRFEHFAFKEVPNEEGQQLDDSTRYMAILATLIGCQGVEEYRGILLPLEGQCTTTLENRLEKGVQAQVEIYNNV